MKIVASCSWAAKINDSARCAATVRYALLFRRHCDRIESSARILCILKQFCKASAADGLELDCSASGTRDTYPGPGLGLGLGLGQGRAPGPGTGRRPTECSSTNKNWRGNQIRLLLLLPFGLRNNADCTFAHVCVSPSLARALSLSFSYNLGVCVYKCVCAYLCVCVSVHLWRVKTLN